MDKGVKRQEELQEERFIHAINEMRRGKLYSYVLVLFIVLLQGVSIMSVANVPNTVIGVCVSISLVADIIVLLSMDRFYKREIRKIRDKS